LHKNLETPHKPLPQNEVLSAEISRKQATPVCAGLPTPLSSCPNTQRACQGIPQKVLTSPQEPPAWSHTGPWESRPGGHVIMSTAEVLVQEVGQQEG